jgi:tetratricopeptide (TPR) repeat protein
MGALLCQKQDFVHAEQVLQRGLALEPGSALGKFYLGMAQFALNRLVEAERNVRQALVRDAKLPGARILLERIHLRQASAQSSIEASTQAGRP